MGEVRPEAAQRLSRGRREPSLASRCFPDPWPAYRLLPLARVTHSSNIAYALPMIAESMSDALYQVLAVDAPASSPVGETITTKGRDSSGAFGLFESFSVVRALHARNIERRCSRTSSGRSDTVIISIEAAESARTVLSLPVRPTRSHVVASRHRKTHRAPRGRFYAVSDQ